MLRTLVILLLLVNAGFCKDKKKVTKYKGDVIFHECVATEQTDEHNSICDPETMVCKNIEPGKHRFSCKCSSPLIEDTMDAKTKEHTLVYYCNGKRP